jgi:hypothetical protein
MSAAAPIGLRWWLRWVCVSVWPAAAAGAAAGSAIVLVAYAAPWPAWTLLAFPLNAAAALLFGWLCARGQDRLLRRAVPARVEFADAWRRQNTWGLAVWAFVGCLNLPVCMSLQAPLQDPEPFLAALFRDFMTLDLLALLGLAAMQWHLLRSRRRALLWMPLVMLSSVPSGLLAWWAFRDLRPMLATLDILAVDARPGWPAALAYVGLSASALAAAWVVLSAPTGVVLLWVLRGVRAERQAGAAHA